MTAYSACIGTNSDFAVWIAEISTTTNSEKPIFKDLDGWFLTELWKGRTHMAVRFITLEDGSILVQPGLGNKSKPFYLIRDACFPDTMWRIQRNGKLSDMVNLSRAKDAATKMVNLLNAEQYDTEYPAV